MEQFIAMRIRELERLQASTTDIAKRQAVDALVIIERANLASIQDFVGPRRPDSLSSMENPISEKFQSLMPAEESLRKLDGIVASTMDGIISIDSNEHIILFNPAAEQMFDLSAEAALGQHISLLMPERYRAAHSGHIAGFKNERVSNRRMGALGVVSGLRSNGMEFPIEASMSQIGSDGSTIATVILRDITERKASEDARDLLARELDHRAKNMLAIVQALVSLTQAPTKEAFVDAISGRVASLARAHTLLAQNSWEGAKLLQIILDETAAYSRPGQLEIEGPSIILNASAVQPISLPIHELAINALKYGAFSVDTGRVQIRLTLLAGGQLELRWTELGGPPVQEPAVVGFGTTLIREVAAPQLAGAVDVRWPIEGLQLTMTLLESAHRVDVGRIPVVRNMTEPAPRAPGGGRRVLVVEDETVVAMALCADLALRGWEILGPAASVEAAVRLLANASPPDVAVLDVNLSGLLVYPLAEQLRTQGIPFIFCTGYERLDHHEHYRNDGIFRKPVNINQLTAQLHLLTAA